MTAAILLTAFGLVLLVAGADLLVRGASKAAELLRAPSLIVGLTLVAWGTSAPELAVSLGASLAGRPEVALGNVIGSNLANTLLILGLGALIIPLAVERPFVRRDIPVLLAATLGVWFLLLDGVLSRIDAAILLVALVAYTYVLILHARRSREVDDLLTEMNPEPVTTKAVMVAALSALGGLVALIVGADWLVDGATEIALWAGLSARVIGLTLVAVGTSLPEVAATVVAGMRGERDLALGNVLGSNVFNLLGILGVTGAAARETAVPELMLAFDIPLLVGTAVLLLPLAVSGLRISRAEGAVLLLLYGSYMVWLFVAGEGAPSWPAWAFLGGCVLFATGQLAVGLRRRKSNADGED